MPRRVTLPQSRCQELDEMSSTVSRAFGEIHWTRSMTLRTLMGATIVHTGETQSGTPPASSFSVVRLFEKKFPGESNYPTHLSPAGEWPRASQSGAVYPVASPRYQTRRSPESGAGVGERFACAAYTSSVGSHSCVRKHSTRSRKSWSRSNLRIA